MFVFDVDKGVKPGSELMKGSETPVVGAVDVEGRASEESGVRREEVEEEAEGDCEGGTRGREVPERDGMNVLAGEGVRNSAKPKD